MPMNTESPEAPVGQVPIGGWSAAKARDAKPAGSASPPATPRPVRMNRRRPSAKGADSRSCMGTLMNGNSGKYIVARYSRTQTGWPPTHGNYPHPQTGGPARERPLLLKRAEKQFKLA